MIHNLIVKNEEEKATFDNYISEKKFLKSI